MNSRGRWLLPVRPTLLWWKRRRIFRAKSQVDLHRCQSGEIARALRGERSQCRPDLVQSLSYPVNHC
ncbi:hypothetical protein SAMN04488112_10227 [Melghirimyces thermohalophilus]|uniref:Uncharacterized protein n=1 Tax=Melghirimyces thermohalophilus TaxID=1236220 RepID=A0A1G6I387_9BACL|nr:hypothetical protein SAMN04488112_10227 [Melghirimyces thermohalophilus]